MTSVHLLTFNCAREAIHVDYFASSIYRSFIQDIPPDLISLALQEIAPVAHSFLGGSLLDPYFEPLKTAIGLAATWKYGEDAAYELVLEPRNAGMTGIMVFVRRETQEKIQRVSEAQTGVGVWNMGNKGAVGVRLVLDGDQEEVLTFVAAHLAPHEKQWKQRNADWRTICETLVFEPAKKSGAKQTTGDTETEPLLASDTATDHATEQGLFNPPGQIFFAGDLNYRASDSKPDPDAPKTYPSPSAPKSEWSDHLAKDQLTRELHARNVLHTLTEAPIGFLPTYKYNSAAQKEADELASAHDISKGSSTNHSIMKSLRSEPATPQPWATHRVPSWCDRILFLANSQPQIAQYGALPVQPTSDHRPVFLSLTLSANATTAVDELKAPFAVSKDWRARRDAARQLERIVGAAMFMGGTWQGLTTLSGLVIAALLVTGAVYWARP